MHEVRVSINTEKSDRAGCFRKDSSLPKKGPINGLNMDFFANFSKLCHYVFSDFFALKLGDHKHSKVTQLESFVKDSRLPKKGEKRDSKCPKNWTFFNNFLKIVLFVFLIFLYEVRVP